MYKNYSIQKMLPNKKRELLFCMKTNADLENITTNGISYGTN